MLPAQQVFCHLGQQEILLCPRFAEVQADSVVSVSLQLHGRGRVTVGGSGTTAGCSPCWRPWCGAAMQVYLRNREHRLIHSSRILEVHLVHPSCGMAGHRHRDLLQLCLRR